MIPGKSDRWIDIHEAKKLTGQRFSMTTLRDHARNGIITSRKIDGRWFFSEQELRERCWCTKRDPWITAAQARKILKLGPNLRTLREYAWDGTLQHMRIGNRYMYRLSQIRNLNMRRLKGEKHRGREFGCTPHPVVRICPVCRAVQGSDSPKCSCSKRSIMQP